MTDPGNGYSAKGDGDSARPEVGSMPFFPGVPDPAGRPPGKPTEMPQERHGDPARHEPGDRAVAPLPAPVPAPAPAAAAHQVPAGGRHSHRGGEHVAEQPAAGHAGAAGTGGAGGAVVNGRITVEDEVAEKIATLAALEVSGIAGLGGRAGRAADGTAAARPGVRVQIADGEIRLDLTVVVEYGSVIMDVAKVVKSNVARVVGLMLGMRVAAVDITVDDVRMPGA